MLRPATAAALVLLCVAVLSRASEEPRDLQSNNIWRKLQASTATPSPVRKPVNLVSRATLYDRIAMQKDTSVFTTLLDLTPFKAQLSDPAFAATVFAPCDAAFKNVPQQLLVRLGEDTAALQEFVGSCIVPGVANVTFFRPSQSLQLPTLAPSGRVRALRVSMFGQLQLDGSCLVSHERQNIPATNGLLHLTDAAVLPFKETPLADDARQFASKTVWEALQTLDSAFMFRSIANGTALQEVLQDANLKATVFVPVDRAWRSLSPQTIQMLSSKFSLGQVLSYHIVGGPLASADVPQTPAAPVKATTTLNAPLLFLRGATDGLTGRAPTFINGYATVVAPDIACSNGVIQLVDAVLLPSVPRDSPELLAAREIGLPAVAAAQQTLQTPPQAPVTPVRAPAAAPPTVPRTNAKPPTAFQPAPLPAATAFNARPQQPVAFQQAAAAAATGKPQLAAQSVPAAGAAGAQLAGLIAKKGQ